MKTCCFSGHRDLTDEQLQTGTIALVGFINLAIEKGYTHFISGFADGIDLIAANIVAKNKLRNKNISLEAAIPYENRMKNRKLQELLEVCEKITVTSKVYTPGCCHTRNKYMIDNSKLLIAVWDGRTHGGTFQTINYAKEIEKEVKIISV